MGIQGLLPFLKGVLTPSHIRNYRGCTVAIDTYCWLHKGAFACAEKLAAGEPTDMYVYYCMKYVNMLLSYDIKPILVFDGCHLPSKKAVETKRRERRELNRKKAVQLLREGKRKEARDALVQCIDITPQMALELMNACREKGVDCITAPYEADAQLAFLSNAGIAQVIITEDSDLILFGCHTIMFKMDTAGGGMLIQNTDLNKAMKLKDTLYTFDKFRYMCMLSGCDYHSNLPGIGLSKACKAMKLTRQIDVKLILKKIPMLLNIRNLTVTTEYIEGFVRADNTFLYQLVFDPLTRQLVPLNPYPPGLQAKDLPYAGPLMTNEKALSLALGNMDIKGNVIANFDPSTHKPKSQSWEDKSVDHPHLLSIWDPEYKPRGKVLETEETSRPLTKGKEVLLQAMGISNRSTIVAKRRSDPPKVEQRISERKVVRSPPKKVETEEILAEDLVGLLDDEELSPPPQKKPRMSISLIETHKETREPVVPKPASKNVFASSNLSKVRSRFSLDGSEPLTEVKSRFFSTASKPLAKTTFYSALKSEIEEVEVKADSPDSPQNLTTPSCGFSSKLSQFRRNSDVKSSPATRNPFKKVTTATPSDKRDIISTAVSQASQSSVSSSQESQRSSQLYSLDMDRWDSQKSVESPRLPTLSCELTSLKSSPVESTLRTPSLSQSSIVSASPVLKSGCKPLGLSKMKNKAKTKSSSENQATMRNFFESKFAYSQKAEKSKPLSPSKNNII